VNAKAARAKGIASLVAGHANVGIAPNLESGNMLAKGLTFVARAEAAGLAAGAAPRILAARGPGPRGGRGRRAGGGTTA
jgi:phosphate butyryltransferase